MNYWNVRELYHTMRAKMVSEKASPQFVARGWAIGMFCGCVIPFGVQIAIAIPLAWILRGSKIGATLGTFISNHLTIFVLYPVQCYLGSLILLRPLAYATIHNKMQRIIELRSWDALFSLGSELCAAFLVGGLLFAAILTPITYIGVRNFIIHYRAHIAAKATATRVASAANVQGTPQVTTTVASAASQASSKDAPADKP